MAAIDKRKMKYPTYHLTAGKYHIMIIITKKYTKGFEALPYDPSRYMYRHRRNEIVKKNR